MTDSYGKDQALLLLDPADYSVIPDSVAPKLDRAGKCLTGIAWVCAPDYSLIHVIDDPAC